VPSFVGNSIWRYACYFLSSLELYSHLKANIVILSVGTHFDSNGRPQIIKFYKDIKTSELHWIVSFN
jgi:hypothetical protein